MKTSIKYVLPAFAFCLVGILTQAQTEKGFCKLGDGIPDSLLASADSLEIILPADMSQLKAKSDLLGSLDHITIKGNTSGSEWNDLTGVLALLPELRSLHLSGNSLSTLPSGFTRIHRLEKLIISENEDIDYFLSIGELTDLANLRDLTLDIFTIFEIPDSLNNLKSLQRLHLVNKDELLSGSDSSLAQAGAATYDYSVQYPGNAPVLVKYTATSGLVDSDEYLALEKRFREKTTVEHVAASASSSSYMPDYRFIAPPIKGVDVERSVYLVNTGIEQVIVAPSGTKIKIPANAFVDKNNQPVTGIINLSYREFRDQVDCLVSGIPMKYDSAGRTGNFESAGMFEILASAGGTPLQLAPEKKIDMNFSTTSPGSTYNFYAFNDSTGNWDYKTKPVKVTEKTTIPFSALSAAFYQYRYFLSTNPPIPDTCTLAQRFSSANYIYTKQLSPGQTNSRFYYKKKGNNVSKLYSSLVKISSVRKTKDGRILFKIRNVHQAFPELTVYENVFFAVDENISARDFRKKYKTAKGFNDVRIRQEGSQAEVIFKGLRTFQTLNTELVTINHKSEIEELKSAKSFERRYSRRLKSREREFDRKVRQKRHETDLYFRLTEKDDIERYAYKETRKLMKADEKRLSFEEWKAYYEQVTASEKAILNSSKANVQSITASLSLDRFGIYNCDQIQRIDSPVEIFASYMTSEGDKMKPKSAYIVDKKINAVLQYDGYRGFSASKIAFSNNKDAENVLLVINEDGSLAIYQTEDFRKNTFTNDTRFNFNVTPVSSISTVGDLKKMMGL